MIKNQPLAGTDWKLPSPVEYHISIYMMERYFVMTQILLSLPDELAAQLKAKVPPRQRSKFIAGLLMAEWERRENELFQCALSVERDAGLNAEMQDWESTVADGLDE